MCPYVPIGVTESCLRDVPLQQVARLYHQCCLAEKSRKSQALFGLRILLSGGAGVFWRLRPLSFNIVHIIAIITTAIVHIMLDLLKMLHLN
jgi:hypothetical protein